MLILQDYFTMIRENFEFKTYTQARNALNLDTSLHLTLFITHVNLATSAAYEIYRWLKN